MLFYECLVVDMIFKGFERNPYSPCVAKQIIEGNQIISRSYVEDLKVSHVALREVTNFMKYLEGVYGDKRITRGKVHKYLRMTLDFWTQGELQVTMLEDLKRVLEDFPEVITRRSTIPAANNIFQVGTEEERTLLKL